MILKGIENLYFIIIIANLQSFIAYPTACSELVGSQFWCLLLFAMIFLLGIDSAFSYVEAVSTVVHD